MKKSKIKHLRALIVKERLIDASLKLTILIISVIFIFGAII